VIVEGVMGLFDGHRDDPDSTSTAAVAALLDAPVLLVLDASNSASTLAAVASGLARFDDRVRVEGVVLNRFREGRDRSAIESAFARVGLPVLGWLPSSGDNAIGSRHLGLTLAEETSGAEVTVARTARRVERFVDVDAVLALARGASESEIGDEPPAAAGATALPAAPPAARARIAVARDAAFAFYYPDNLEAIERAGGSVVEFSPLADAALPDDVCGLYLGGGYPELHAASLAQNASMLAAVAQAADAGMPVFAECGGMLYLLESLTDAHGEVHTMAGVLPASARMNVSLQRVGYVDATLASDCVLGEEGTRVRGHEFRYSACEPAAGKTAAWFVDGEGCGFSQGSVVASYLHLNFAGCPDVAAAFVEACRAYAATNRGGTDE
jgi:cobyrinic acid a,c-diamide synthase